MTQNDILAEAYQRLEHLRTLPETPMRKREIMSIERLIASGITTKKSSRPGRKASSSRVKKESSEDDDLEDIDESPQKSTREIEQAGEHRRITIRTVKEGTHSEKDEDEELKKEHKQRMSNIQTVLGLKYRGFS